MRRYTITSILRRVFAPAIPPGPRDGATARREPGPDQTWRATHRHRKGGLYRVVTHGILEADRSDVVIYDDAEGTTWVRGASEFYDGRFVALDDKD